MIDGYWHKLKKQWSGDQKNWANWPVTVGSDGAWACHTCDTFQVGQVDSYEGNYGSDKYCRLCGEHKGDAHHMLMPVRAGKIQAGTYLARDDARALRIQRKEGVQESGKGKGLWGYDNKGKLVRADVVRGVQDKRLAELEYKEQLTNTLFICEIDLVEFKKRLKQGLLR